MAVSGDKLLLFSGVVFVLLNLAAASRYKTCSDSKECCENEFCAYGMVCYPITKCRYGCPDGVCETHDDGKTRACLPDAPCRSSKECQPGHACSFNFNLGYPTCQYDLDIGSSVMCAKKGDHGGLEANALDENYEKRSFLARWRGKAAFRAKNGVKGAN